MELTGRNVRREQYHAVGYDPETGGSVLAVVVTWIAWFERYCRISGEEYAWFDTDPDRLDRLTEACCRAGPAGDRFLGSQRAAEHG